MSARADAERALHDRLMSAFHGGGSEFYRRELVPFAVEALSGISDSLSMRAVKALVSVVHGASGWEDAYERLSKTEYDGPEEEAASRLMGAILAGKCPRVDVMAEADGNVEIRSWPSTKAYLRAWREKGARNKDLRGRAFPGSVRIHPAPGKAYGVAVGNGYLSVIPGAMIGLLSGPAPESGWDEIAKALIQVELLEKEGAIRPGTYALRQSVLHVEAFVEHVVKSFHGFDGAEGAFPREILQNVADFAAETGESPNAVKGILLRLLGDSVEEADIDPFLGDA